MSDEPLTEAELDAMQQWANDSPMNSRYNANFHRLLAEVRRLSRLECQRWAEVTKLKAELERMEKEIKRLSRTAGIAWSPEGD